MGRIRTLLPTTVETIEGAYDRARGSWSGCDWPTSFGDTALDLNGITSHQALLMARATAGLEAADWREAVQWLRLVEANAEAAEEAARWAVEAAARGDLAAARREAGAAFDLEARYHPRPVWMDLRDAVDNTPVPAIR
jgi:hypothetical protein